MSVRILQGDCLDVLRTLPDESVHCVVTSPPYWGLRDYGVAGQLGLEATPAEYVEKMVKIFRELFRVLRSDGTLWLNLGDSYTSSGCGGDTGKSGLEGSTDSQDASKASAQLVAASRSTKREQRPHQSFRRDREPVGETRHRSAPARRAKNLVGIPWLVAFALQADGWYLRQDIIWSKPNPMPESVRDRCTKAHEYLFLLAKSERYSYDAEAIKEPAAWTRENNPDWQTQRANTNAKKGAGNRNAADGGFTGWSSEDGRNKRSVWTVATQSFSEAHFATFPPKLIEPCILAGCPKGGTVLDPFGGAGTTGLVADRHGRNAILIELNPGYAAMAERRIHADGPLFAEVTT